MFWDLSSFKAHLSSVRMLYVFPRVPHTKPRTLPGSLLSFLHQETTTNSRATSHRRQKPSDFSRSVTRRFRQPLHQQRGGSPERRSAIRPALRSHFKERRSPRCRGRPTAERRGCGRAARRRKMEPRAAGRAAGGPRLRAAPPLLFSRLSSPRRARRIRPPPSAAPAPLSWRPGAAALPTSVRLNPAHLRPAPGAAEQRQEEDAAFPSRERGEPRAQPRARLRSGGGGKGGRGGGRELHPQGRAEGPRAPSRPHPAAPAPTNRAGRLPPRRPHRPHLPPPPPPAASPAASHEFPRPAPSPPGAARKEG